MQLAALILSDSFPFSNIRRIHSVDCQPRVDSFFKQCFGCPQQFSRRICNTQYAKHAFKAVLAWSQGVPYSDYFWRRGTASSGAAGIWIQVSALQAPNILDPIHELSYFLGIQCQSVVWRRSAYINWVAIYYLNCSVIGANRHYYTHYQILKCLLQLLKMPL